jgi:hypothetical protein
VVTRIWNALALISTGALIGTLCLWMVASRIWRSQQIALGPGFHATVQRSGFDGQLLLFNDPKNGPHYGINALHSVDVSRPLPGIAVWSSSGGLTAHPGWWTAYVSLLYPIGLFAIAPTVWLLRKRKPSGRGFPVCGDTATG